MIALQGPQAAQALARLAPDCASLVFLQGAAMDIDGAPAFVTRSGYTGEDGFEIYLDAADAAPLAEKLCAMDGVSPAGLGARDSLRLEAGLCLYGHDITEDTTPVEAGLTWSIGKRRREEGGFPGDAVILDQIAQGPPRRRVGLALEGRAPARKAGTALALMVRGKALPATVTKMPFVPTRYVTG